MIAYTLYDGDARIRREAETLVATGAYEVLVLTLKDRVAVQSQMIVDGVRIQQLNIAKYRGQESDQVHLVVLAHSLARAADGLASFASSGRWTSFMFTTCRTS